MDLEKLCNEVLDSDAHIRFTGILNSRGDLEIEKNKADTPLLTDDEVKMSVHYTYERWNRLQNLEHRLGKEKVSFTEYENVAIMSIVMGKNLFLLSVDPDVDYSKIISSTKEIIKKYEN